MQSSLGASCPHEALSGLCPQPVEPAAAQPAALVRIFRQLLLHDEVSHVEDDRESPDLGS